MAATPDECRHGMLGGTCSICRDETPVYMSGGGIAYHRTRRCPALNAGQDEVIARGGVTSRVEVRGRSTAEAEGRRACLTCWE